MSAADDSGGARRPPRPSKVAYEGRTDAVSAGLVRDADERSGSMTRGVARMRAARAAQADAFAADPEPDDRREASEDALDRTARKAGRAVREHRGRNAAEGHLVHGAGTGKAAPPATTCAVGAGDDGTVVGGDGPTLAGRNPAQARTLTDTRDRSRTSVLRRRRASGPVRGGTRPKARPAGGHASSRAASARAAARAQAAGATAGASARTSAGAVAVGAPAVLAPVAGVVTGILAFVVASVVVSQLVGSLFGFWRGEEQRRSVAGLPPYVTYSMVEEALRCQEDYGHPAGCTIAQIILESGVGDHLSGLATRDNNLFGIKWASAFAPCPEVTGKESWQTSEEVAGGTVSITDAFTCFASPEDCIRFRSRVLLQNARYAGNPIIRQAISEHSSDLMAEGLKDAGYATSSSYVDNLKSVMDTYGLRRFDTMGASDLASATSADGNAVVAAAMTQLGVPYVWGGTTPGVGFDCSGLTQWCYAQAGIPIPRVTEDQMAAGTCVPLSEARPGDILWRSGHVAVYLGGNSYIHAPRPGDHVRVAEGISRFTCAVRF